MKKLVYHRLALLSVLAFAAVFFLTGATSFAAVVYEKTIAGAALYDPGGGTSTAINKIETLNTLGITKVNPTNTWTVNKKGYLETAANTPFVENGDNIIPTIQGGCATLSGNADVYAGANDFAIEVPVIGITSYQLVNSISTDENGGLCEPIGSHSQEVGGASFPAEIAAACHNVVIRIANLPIADG